MVTWNKSGLQWNNELFSRPGPKVFFSSVLRTENHRAMSSFIFGVVGWNWNVISLAISHRSHSYTSFSVGQTSSFEIILSFQNIFSINTPRSRLKIKLLVMIFLFMQTFYFKYQTYHIFKMK